MNLKQKIISFLKKYIVISCISLLGFISVAWALTLKKSYYVYWADFRLPESGLSFLNKHLYLWSVNGSTLNLDGIIRFFARLPVMAFFLLTQNQIASSYFYTVIVIIISYISFQSFCKYFLEIKNKLIVNVLPILFTFNPIFLGNFSKIGLVLATVLLPLILVNTKLIFQKKKIFPYSLYIIILLNFSFIHPFNLLFNAATFFILFAYYGCKNTQFIKLKWFQLIKSILIGIILNLYILVPLLDLRTVDKSSISSSIGNGADILNLTNIAKTDSILEALSLSKNIFLDFRFYTDTTKNIYYFAIYGILVILLGLITWNYYNYHKINKKTLIASCIFLVLALLSTGRTYGFTRGLYNIIDILPISWVFRSPLKWQLYISMFLFSIIAYEISLIGSKKVLKKIFYSIVILFSIANVVLIKDVFTNLLAPKQLQSFQEIQKENLNGKRVLFVNSPECNDLAQDHLDKYNELIFSLSKNENSFNVLDNEKLETNKLLLNQFDYLVYCDEKTKESLVATSDFTQLSVQNDFGISFYKKNTVNNVFNIVENTVNTNVKFINDYDDSFLKSRNINTINTLFSTTKKDSDRKLNRVFNQDIGLDNLQNGLISFNVKKEELLSNNFYINENYNYLYYTLINDELEIKEKNIGELYFNDEKITPDTTVKEKTIFSKKLGGQKYSMTGGVYNFDIREGSWKIGYNQDFTNIKLSLAENPDNSKEDILFTKPNYKQITLRDNIKDENTLMFKSSLYKYNNKLENGSFEDGPWEQKVRDCYNYDDKPRISMKIKKDLASEGNNSLELSSANHVACTQQNFSISPGSKLLVSFDYKGSAGGYLSHVLLDKNSNNLSSKSIEIKDSNWHTEYKFDEIPKNTGDVIFNLRALPLDGLKQNKVLFDNAKIFELPNLDNLLYQYDEVVKPTNGDEKLIVDSRQLNPTEYDLSIQNITKSQYLFFNQNYNNKWVITNNSGQVIDLQHYIGNQIQNAWYLDLDKLCSVENVCDKNENNEIKLNLKVVFITQKYFMWALAVSSIGFIVVLTCIILSIRKNSKSV